MKQKSKISLFLLVFSFFSFNLMSQDLSSENQLSEKLILTVEDATEFAIKNSRTLKVSAIDVEIAKLKKDNAWNVFLPSVQVTGTMSRSNEVSNTSAEMMDGIMSGFMEMLMPLYTKHPELLGSLPSGSSSSSWSPISMAPIAFKAPTEPPYPQANSAIFPFCLKCPLTPCFSTGTLNIADAD